MPTPEGQRAQVDKASAVAEAALEARRVLEHRMWTQSLPAPAPDDDFAPRVPLVDEAEAGGVAWHIDAASFVPLGDGAIFDDFGEGPSWHVPESSPSTLCIGEDQTWKSFGDGLDLDFEAKCGAAPPNWQGFGDGLDLGFEGFGSGSLEMDFGSGSTAPASWWLPEEFAPHLTSASTSSSTAATGELAHKHVRRTVDLAAQYQYHDSKAPPTTLMLRSMPRNFTRRRLFALLDENGFAGKYDFLYLPLDSGTHCSVGYAFVNFEDPESAAEFKTTMYGYTFPGHHYNDPRDSRKRAMHISIAHLQGVLRNMEHLQMSAVLTSNPAARPWFRSLEDGFAEFGYAGNEERPATPPEIGAPALWWAPEPSLQPWCGGDFTCFAPPPGLEFLGEETAEDTSQGQETAMAAFWSLPSSGPPQEAEEAPAVLARLLRVALPASFRWPRSSPVSLALPQWSRCLNFLAVAVGRQLAVSKRFGTEPANNEVQRSVSVAKGPRAATDKIRKDRISKPERAQPLPSEAQAAALVAPTPLRMHAKATATDALGGTVDTKPLDIKDWPALGAPKAGAKVSSQSTATRQSKPKETPLKVPFNASPSWLVPMPSAPPAAPPSDGKKAAQPPPASSLIQPPKLGH